MVYNCRLVFTNGPSQRKENTNKHKVKLLHYKQGRKGRFAPNTELLERKKSMSLANAKLVIELL